MLFATPHFRFSELDCHNGEPVPEALKPEIRRLCEYVLEPLRALHGPLVVVSGWRSLAYNERIGGAAHSQHCLGTAADIRPADIGDLSRLEMTIRHELENHHLPDLGGWGVYPNWIHVDTRMRPPGGHVAHWTGAGVGGER